MTSLLRWHHFLNMATTLMMFWILTAFLVSVYVENQLDVKAQNPTKSTLVSNDNVDPPGNYHQKIMDSVSIDPEDAKFWYLLGFAYVESEQYVNAIEAFQQALRIDPEYADAWYNLGAAYAYLGQRSKVIEIYQRLKGLDTNWADSFFKNIVMP